MPKSKPTSQGSSAATAAKLPKNDAAAAQQLAESNAMAAAMPFNPTKAAEHGLENGQHPPRGSTVKAESRLSGASTLSENHASDKTGEPAAAGRAPSGDLARVRGDSTGQMLTTIQSVAIADNQSSLKMGVRGKALL